MANLLATALGVGANLGDRAPFKVRVLVDPLRQVDQAPIAFGVHVPFEPVVFVAELAKAVGRVVVICVMRRVAKQAPAVVAHTASSASGITVGIPPRFTISATQYITPSLVLHTAETPHPLTK